MAPKHQVNGGASYKTGCLVRSNCEGGNQEIHCRGWGGGVQYTRGRKKDKLFWCQISYNDIGHNTGTIANILQ